MRLALQGIRLLALGLVVGLAPVCQLAAAQEAAPKSAQSETDEGIHQIKLTEAQVQGYIAAQPDMAAILPKLQKADDEPDSKMQAELDAIAKKHGFADFKELNDVATNISIVMAGFDSETGEFIEPVEALKKELEDIKGDTSIPEAEKKQLVEELSEAIKTTPVLQHRENVDLVKAHRQEIEKALE